MELDYETIDLERYIFNTKKSPDNLWHICGIFHTGAYNYSVV